MRQTRTKVSIPISASSATYIVNPHKFYITTKEVHPNLVAVICEFYIATKEVGETLMVVICQFYIGAKESKDEGNDVIRWILDHHQPGSRDKQEQRRRTP